MYHMPLSLVNRLNQTESIFFSNFDAVFRKDLLSNDFAHILLVTKRNKGPTNKVTSTPIDAF